jgi:hypothetical protein
MRNSTAPGITPVTGFQTHIDCSDLMNRECLSMAQEVAGHEYWLAENQLDRSDFATDNLHNLFLVY